MSSVTFYSSEAACVGGALSIGGIFLFTSVRRENGEKKGRWLVAVHRKAVHKKRHFILLISSCCFDKPGCVQQPPKLCVGLKAVLLLLVLGRGGQIDPNINSIDTKVSIGIGSILA